MALESKIKYSQFQREIQIVNSFFIKLSMRGGNCMLFADTNSTQDGEIKTFVIVTHFVFVVLISSTANRVKLLTFIRNASSLSSFSSLHLYIYNLHTCNYILDCCVLKISYKDRDNHYKLNNNI